MTRAIYPGSFDPFHNGHCDIARRAAGLFDELIVTVFDAPAKRLLFSTDERIQLAREAVQDVENISIVSYSGLTVKWAERHDVRVIVRGLRNVDDLSFESRIDMANRHMAPQIETCYLLCSTEYAYLSSTILKEVAGLDGDISGWVTPHTARALRRRFE
ncbi:MAG: pantetheine-phosphate adenylyltransferase [Caldilineaceae bacterium]|nr:pantetheine-phosphate adenylyltransferase [Caldilineaceae bacterium]MCY4090488.1 pantetheine-phosphate adenylyltransferase [Caldilineaceae bacterium]MCY4117714.1 pantetheine-phosphate adenylyltransferase [Caldilineaceae bacterium]MDE0071367.1 pantetheine-phosphate adenylyltransferase [Caldilineaceae bacterium]MDE0183592.1 pantetheine-phosphate adenylyltransferase [Caldilineaceae bacterium]